MKVKAACILVIDDNEDILFMIKAMLEMKGYTIIAKENAENIELVIEKVKPDLILMDMLLAGEDGRAICKIIKKNKAIAQIPIIMISALSDSDISCRAAGAACFLAKPFEMGDLLFLVASTIDR